MFRVQCLLAVPAPSANKKPLCVPDGVLQAGDTLQVKIHYEKDDHCGWQQVHGEKETKKFCQKKLNAITVTSLVVYLTPPWPRQQ